MLINKTDDIENRIKFRKLRILRYNLRFFCVVKNVDMACGLMTIQTNFLCLYLDCDM